MTRKTRSGDSILSYWKSRFAAFFHVLVYHSIQSPNSATLVLCNEVRWWYVASEIQGMTRTWPQGQGWYCPLKQRILALNDRWDQLYLPLEKMYQSEWYGCPIASAFPIYTKSRGSKVSLTISLIDLTEAIIISLCHYHDNLRACGFRPCYMYYM
jgi:hypothetical protein